MDIALYPGSFNPPHVGHAMVASWVRWTGQADSVWWAPSFSHPFEKKLAPFDARLAMVESVVDQLGQGMRAIDIESRLPTPSYTIQVLDALAAENPGARFRLVIGADLLPTLHKWREAERLVDVYRPIVVGRDGYENPPGCVVFPEISSSEVRRLAAAGDDYSHLVSDRVIEDARRLYSSEASSAGPNPSQP
ncbi:MAG: nicotinate-nicotinamide nucleotide adenylyltransferase [Proteobacteria bacterium]|nr:nicotinate-nicotinamide nucleotide adenylyltransferase [Pseudomonadota bacterium]